MLVLAEIDAGCIFLVYFLAVEGGLDVGATGHWLGLPGSFERPVEGAVGEDAGEDDVRGRGWVRKTLRVRARARARVRVRMRARTVSFTWPPSTAATRLRKRKGARQPEAPAPPASTLAMPDWMPSSVMERRMPGGG